MGKDIGGIFLHNGHIAEMRTGEGKTLVATLPVYLNALTGKGVHVVTVNDYLAKRDSEWMGKIYRFFIKMQVYINIIKKVKKRCRLFYNLWYNRIVRIDNLGILCPKQK